MRGLVSEVCARVALFLVLTPLLAAAAIRPDEQKLYDDAQGVTPRAVVRREARALLETHPQSFVAAYVLGKLESEDGQYPDAIREFRRARDHASLHTAANPDDQKQLAQWRARIALSLADVLDQADRLQEALRTWDEAERLYREAGGMPDRTRRRIDALLKLGNISAAEQIATARLQTPDLPDDERFALRVASARILFSQEPDGQRAYEAFESLVREASNNASFTAPLGDLAFHARRQGDTERALAVLKQSAGMQHPGSAAHPFRGMAEVHLSAANWDAARADIRNAWNAMQTKRADIRHELLADTRLVAASFYLAAGYPNRAERLARPYVSHPIRSGFSSRPSEQWQAGVNLLCWSASRQIRLLERASAAHRPWHERIGLFGHHLVRRWDEAILARRIRALVLDQLQRGRPIRDAHMVVDAPLWLWGDLALVLGPRSFRELFAAHPLRGAPHRFFSRAMDVEAAFAEKDWDVVTSQGAAALDDIPAGEALLRARLSQRIAASEYRRGNTDAALSWFERAYRLDRAAPLKSGVRLPVANLPGELRGSSLLMVVDAGARLFVDRTDDAWTCRTIWPSGAEIQTPQVAADPQLDPARRAHHLHRLLFSPVGLLQESDYAALEGEAASGPPEKEDRLDRLLRPKGR